MLFLSEQEKQEWASYARNIVENGDPPGAFSGKIRANLMPAFSYYVATILSAHGRTGQCFSWLESGTLKEEDGLFSCAFLLGFLKRHGGRLVAPAVAFRDPGPFLHFAGVPAMKEARRQFIRQSGHTLPHFERPLRIMDIGCGDGGLTAALLAHLQETGKVREVEEVLLVDPSPAMLELAKKTVGDAVPGARITAANSRIQDFSGRIEGRFDVAMSSLAYHHMPLEQKEVHLARLKPRIDHFLLFELDANHDTPGLHSPELAFSLYQGYGRIIDFVFAHDAPVELAVDCVDSFLMTELVSLLTQPRGIRTDYHMLRSQWNDLFREQLGPGFTLRCDSSCYADEYLTLFTMHYGRTG